jgi:uncharacterized protein with GYD domain
MTMHGHTYDLTTEQRIRNLAAQVSRADVVAAAAQCDGGDFHEFERVLTGYAMAAIQDSDAGATLAAMENRVNVISAAICDAANSGKLTTEEIESLFNEQAELLNRIARAEDDAADDFADMRRENAYGKGL